jgi:hypothetical protein
VSLQFGEILVQLYQPIGKCAVRRAVRLEQPSPELSNPQQVELCFRSFPPSTRTVTFELLRLSWFPVNPPPLVGDQIGIRCRAIGAAPPSSLEQFRTVILRGRS